LNPSDVYDVSRNKCVSNTDICKDGIYNTTLKTCTIPFIGSCTTVGYKYDPISDSCVDNSKELCSEQSYFYNVSKESCIGTMKVCETGKTYNETTKLCEETVCGDLNTLDSNSRCETSNLCDGVLTNIGKCIPNTIQ
jgi:hypothetical protein